MSDISKEDVLKVAQNLNFQPTEEEIKKVIDNYENEANSDPTGNLELWIENLLNTFNIKKVYKSKTKLFGLKKVPTDFPNIKITRSKDAAEFIRKFYQDDIEIYESFFVLLLNKANVTIGYAKISQGGIAGTVVDTKIIAKYCIESLASNVILCHNHPSGNTKASQSDKEITNKIIQTLKLIDTVVLDHLIITKNSYLSFSDEGLI